MITGKNNSAVSPVVGVMLMLVVTIIIAAVVSAFAGGLGGADDKAPNVMLKATLVSDDGIEGTRSGGVYSYPAGYTCDNNYILFENIGGDTFSLSDVELQIQLPDSKMGFSLADTPTYSDASCISCRADAANSTYLEEIGDNADGNIRPGDRFKFTFDGNRASSSSLRFILQKEGAGGGLTVEANSNIHYVLIDKTTGKTIQTGDVSTVV